MSAPAVAMLKPKKATIILSPRLNQNLQIFCAGSGRTKDDVIRAAITEYLERHLDFVIATLTRSISSDRSPNSMQLEPLIEAEDYADFVTS